MADTHRIYTSLLHLPTSQYIFKDYLISPYEVECHLQDINSYLWSTIVQVLGTKNLNIYHHNIKSEFEIITRVEEVK